MRDIYSQSGVFFISVLSNNDSARPLVFSNSLNNSLLKFYLKIISDSISITRKRGDDNSKVIRAEIGEFLNEDVQGSMDKRNSPLDFVLSVSLKVILALKESTWETVEQGDTFVDAVLFSKGLSFVLK